MKRTLLSMLLMVTLTFTLLVGCASDEGATETETEATSETTETKEDTVDEKAEVAEMTTSKISIIASQDWIQEAEIELGKKFEEETGIEVDYQIYPADQYFNVLLTKINAKEEIDIFMSQSGAFDIVSQLNIAENGVDLSNEAWVEGFEPLAIKELSVGDTLYGQTVADTYAVWSVAYNKALFAELGLEVPTSFDEFKAVCEAIKAEDIVPVYEAVADGWHHQLWWLEVGPVYESFEPGFNDALNSNSANITDFEGPKTALNQIKEMVDLGYWGEDYMSNQVANMASSIASGDYAMGIAQQNFGGEVEGLGLGLTSADIGYFVIPLLDNQIVNLNPSAPSRFIFSGSANVEASKMYFDFVARTENLQHILDNSDRYSNLPFEGLANKYDDNIQEFFDSYDESGTVLQTAVKYINPQWMAMGSDITGMLLEVNGAEEVLTGIDQRRAEQAKAATDADWQ